MRFLFFILFSGLILCGCGSKDPASPNYVLAKGQGFKVVRGDVSQESRGDLEKAKVTQAANPDSSGTSQIEKEALEQLIERQLLRKEAGRLGLMSAVEAKVEVEMAAFKKRYGSSEEQERFFNSTGSSKKLLEERFLDRFVLSAIEEKTGIQKPRIPIKKTVEPSPVPNSDPNSVLVQEVQILFPVKPDAVSSVSKEELKKQALALLDIWKKNGGTSWPQLGESKKEGNFIIEPYPHRQYSPQAVPEEFKKVAKNLKPGDYSEIIQSKVGYHILHAVLLGDLIQQRQLEQAKRAEEAYRAEKDKWDTLINGLKQQYGVVLTTQESSKP